MAAKRSTSRAHKRKRIVCSEITGWLRMVEKGAIPTCNEQKMLAAHVRDVFASEDLVIDTDAIERIKRQQCHFPFELSECELFLATLQFCVYKEDGRPRWPDVLLYSGRGFGKTAYMGFVSWCAITKVVGIPYYDVDICANSEEQAKMGFVDVYNILENAPMKDRSRYKKLFRWNKEEVVCRSTQSRLKYRTDNPKSKDGLRSGMVIFDEVHAYTNNKNIEVFKTGLGKKPHPRTLYATTDGDVRDGVLDRLLEKSRRILEGEMPDGGFLPFICKLDSVDDVKDERLWLKANPSLAFRPELMDRLRDEYVDYMDDPASNASFMTKRMNLPQGNPDIQVASWDDIKATDRDIPDVANMPCVVGVDYANTNDFVAAGLLFRIGADYVFRHHTWICTRSKDLPRVKAPLDEWRAKGILEYVDDVEVHPSVVTDWIYRQCATYDVRAVSIDKYRHTLFSEYLEQIGFVAKEGQVKLTRPSDIMLIQPKINSLFVNRNIVWGDDPMMRWYANNTKRIAAQHGNYTYAKIEAKSRKTDGFMAFVAAMCAEDAIPEFDDTEIAEPIII